MALPVDPWSAILSFDWLNVSGWSMFIGVVVLVVLGFFRGWWVPGWLYKRSEKALDASQDALGQALAQNTTLLASQNIVEYVFRELLPPGRPPKRGTKLLPSSDDTIEGGR